MVRQYSGLVVTCSKRKWLQILVCYRSIPNASIQMHILIDQRMHKIQERQPNSNQDYTIVQCETDSGSQGVLRLNEVRVQKLQNT